MAGAVPWCWPIRCVPTRIFPSVASARLAGDVSSGNVAHLRRVGSTVSTEIIVYINQVGVRKVDGRKS